MPKIMSFGNCICEGWQNRAQDLSDRIVSSTATGMNIYPGPMFDFCPYCGRKLVLAGVRVASACFWGGKPISEYNHKELISIIEQMSLNLNKLKNEVSEHLSRIVTGTL